MGLNPRLYASGNPARRVTRSQARRTSCCERKRAAPVLVNRTKYQWSDVSWSNATRKHTGQSPGLRYSHASGNLSPELPPLDLPGPPRKPANHPAAAGYYADMTQTAPRLDPETLVARIVAELQANPEAQQLLLRALLTNEFLGMPARLDRIEADVAELTRRTSRIEADVKVLKSDVKVLKSDVAGLKGDNLEFKLPRRIRPFLSQKLALRRARIMQSLLAVDTNFDLSESVAQAAEAGVISDEQETRLDATDLILRAQRKRDRSTVWIAVEASSTVAGHDVDRAQQSADALQAVFDQDSIAVVVGYGVRAEAKQRAKKMRVEVFTVEDAG